MSYRDLLLRARLLANEGGPPTQPVATNGVGLQPAYGHNLNFQGDFQHRYLMAQAAQRLLAMANQPKPQSVAQAIGAIQPSGLLANQPDSRNPQQVMQALAAEQAARAAQQQPAQPVQPVAQDQVYPAAAYQAPPDQTARALFPAGTPPSATQGQVNESPLTTLDTGAGALFNKGMELVQRIPSVPVTLPNIMATPFHPGATNDQGGTTVHVGPKEIIGLYNKAYMANIGRTGQDMIDVANGGNAPGLNNPYYYVDAGVEDYANDPANKAKIATISVTGLDLNGDGTPDVTGGKAVYLMYIMEHHGGFVDSMVTSMAQDPLFALSFVAPTAEAAHEGTQAGLDIARLVGDRAAVLRAVDRALEHVGQVAHAADVAAQLPFTIPPAVMRAAGQALDHIPVGRDIADLFRKGAEPAAATARDATIAGATDAAADLLHTDADLHQPSQPTQTWHPTDTTGIYTRTEDDAAPAERTVPEVVVHAGELETSVAATDTAAIAGDKRPNQNVYVVTDEAGTVHTFPTRSEAAVYAGDSRTVEPVKVRNAPDYLATKSAERDAAVPKVFGVREADGRITEFPTVEAAKEYAGAQRPERPLLTDQYRNKDGTLNAKARQRAIDEGRIHQTDPVREGNRVVDEAWARGEIDPNGHATFEALYEPKRQEFIAKERAYNATNVPDFREKQARQIVMGVQHTVEDTIPAYAQAYGDLPPISPASKRVVADTPSGKASFRDENVLHLYERYVYEPDAKTAAGIMEVLRAKPELRNAPWLSDVLTDLEKSRADLQAIRDVTPTRLPDQPITVGGTHPTLDQELERWVRESRVSQDTGKVMRSTGKRYEMRDKPTTSSEWKAVDAKQAESYLRKQGWKPGQPIPGKANRVRQVPISGIELLQQIADEFPTASPEQQAAIFGRRYEAATGVKVPQQVDMGKWARAVRGTKKGVAMVASSGRSIAIANPLNILRGPLSDIASDAPRMAMEGHLSAAIKRMNPIDYITHAMSKRGEAQVIADQWGRPLPAELTQHGYRVEGAEPGRTPTHKLASAVTLAKEGSARDRATGVVTGIVDNKLTRDIRQGGDNVGREGVWTSEMTKREPEAMRGLYQRGQMWAEKHDILPTSYQAYVEPLGRASPEELRATLEELGRDSGMSAEDARRAAIEPVKDWTHTRDKLYAAANEEQKRVLFSYERTKADEVAGNFIFYHYWMTRAIPAYLRIALRNPEIAALWIRMWKDVERRAERDGLPDTLRNFIRFQGSMTGFYNSWSPLNSFMPLADLKPEAQKQGWWDQITQFAAVSPILNGLASAVGLSNQIIDPFETYAVRNAAVSIVNDFRAHHGKSPISDPVNTFLASAYDTVNELLSKIPGSPIPDQKFTDPKVFTQVTIRNVVASVFEQEWGIPKEQWTPEQWRVVWSAIADGESGHDNPEYQQGFTQWADAQLKGRVLNSMVPGGVRTRFGPYDALLAGDLTDAQQNAKTLLNSGGPEDATLDADTTEYHALGTPRQRSLSDGWTAIAYNFDKQPPGSVIQIDGHIFSMDDLAKLTQQQRMDIADRWVELQSGGDYNATDDLTSFRTTRKDWVAKHPEYGDYQNWQNMAGDYLGGNHVHEWALDRMKNNPNFKKEYEAHRKMLLDKGVDSSVIDHEMDNWIVSRAGYEAASGIKSNAYADDPLSTGDQGTVNTILNSMSGSGSGGGGGSSSSASSSAYPGAKAVKTLTKDIAKYDTDEAWVADQLKYYGMDQSVLTSSDPYAVDTLQRIFGDLLPKETTLMKQYAMWKKEQPQGADTSVKAFGDYLDNLAAKQAAAGSTEPIATSPDDGSAYLDSLKNRTAA